MEPRLLFIDDDIAVCDAVKTTLTRRGFEVICANAGAEALLALEREPFDAVVSDLKMPGMSGLELCRRARAGWPTLPVVLVTAFASMETAVGAFRAGAYDFIAKPIQMPELLLTLSRALEHRQLKEENRDLRNAVLRGRTPATLIGESPAMHELYALLERIAETDSTVLIMGESGTGKELVAQAIHQRGPHRGGPLVAVNCAAVPDEMLESELFGHVRGSFTDAKASRKGLFVQASGGTIFLDEIGEMPLGMQVKLLRALQERTVRPVGGDREVPFEARVVSATNRDLEADVAEHRFREDLYYRIDVIRITTPPLRTRGNDVLLLAEHFIESFAARSRKRPAELTAPVAQKLLEYDWPGNVRELQNCIERAVVLAQGDALTMGDLPTHIRDFESKRFVLPLQDSQELLPMEEIERRYVLQVLDAVNGSKTQAAVALGFDRRTLYRKLKSYGDL